MRWKSAADERERAIYAAICRHDGVKARDIAQTLGLPRKVVNQYLYRSPFISDLCYRDRDYLWYGMIRQDVPHAGLDQFSGWYGTVAEFMDQDEHGWLSELEAGCQRIGRNLNDTRGLVHSFLDTRQAMRENFQALREFGLACGSWEICFELRIRRARRIRIYTDVLVISPEHAFSLEFKMKDQIDHEEVKQAAKYAPYLEVVLGDSYDVDPALVLTRAHDLYTHVPLEGSTADIPVVSGDMLFNVFDEYLHFLAP
ncbi:MAG: hypothetical protein ACOYJL_01360 [Tractidigestivibacter sp.]|jgi:hypothetical protein|uniref:hypothetical protein n=1 Tax=Tractidigestivibacter sp. TaxID=2847320 RepID=UPI003D918EE6